MRQFRASFTSAFLALLACITSASAQDRSCEPTESSLALQAVAQETIQTLDGISDAELKELSRELAREIREAAPETVPDQVIDRLKHEIVLRVSTVSDGPGTWTTRELLGSRLRNLLETLKKQGRIRYLTEESRKRLGLKEDADSKAVYIPFTGQILVSPKLSERELLRSLFHELKHAYQYTYRFPLDATLLQASADRKQADPKKVEDLLSYLYESQANYHSLQFDTDPAWQKVIKTEVTRRPSSGAKVAGILLTAIVAMPALLLLPVLEEWENHRVKEFIPEIDHDSILGGANSSERKDSALGLSELTPVFETRSNFLSSVWAFGFHERYSRAVARAYGLPLEEQDYKLFNQAHNRYYDAIGESRQFDKEPACQDLISRVRDSDASPMVEWFSVSGSEVASCSAFKAVSDPKQPAAEPLAAWKERLLKEQDPNSPFPSIRRDNEDGGTGTRPDRRVVPSIRIMPELEIKPVDTDKE